MITNSRFDAPLDVMSSTVSTARSNFKRQKLLKALILMNEIAVRVKLFPNSVVLNGVSIAN